MDNETKYSLIESYLLDEMTQEEKQQFEQEMKIDSELRKEFELHKDLHIEFSDDVLDIKEKLSKLAGQTIVQKEENPTQAKRLTLWIRVVSVAAVITLGIIFLPNLLQESLNSKEIYASYYEPYPMGLNQRATDNNIQNASLNEAIQAYIDKDYDKAAAGFDAIYENDKDDVYLLYKASALQAKNDLSGALLIYDNIISNGNERYIQQATWYKGLALIEAGREEEAKSLFRQIEPEHYKFEEVNKIIEALD